MKLQKRFLVILSTLVLTLVLFACGKKLTSIEITGIEDIKVEPGTTFNALTGVKAMGDDGTDYTDRITITSTSNQLNKENGDVNTDIPGEIKVRYEVRVDLGGKVVLAQPWRTITVLKPERGDGLLQDGIAYWEKYENAGGTVNVSEDQGGLKLEITAGNETHEPRISQMLVPFEKGKTYKISFEAKALEEKTINLQSGELLSQAPWFVHFHPSQDEKRTITTEWNKFEYSFKHTIDNQNGGLIFEFGPVAGKKVDTTVWLKNISIVETEEQEDTIPPMFTSGVNDVEIQLGSEFNPLSGVVATDNNDGDISDLIDIISIKLNDEVVESVDTNIADAVYTITYMVTDQAGNETTATRTVTIKDFSAEFGNVIQNGDFKEGLTGWEKWEEGNHLEMKVENEELVLDITGLGANPWDLQVFQEGFRLETNVTYQLTFNARSTVARDINVALGVALTQDPWFLNYLEKQEGLGLTTTNKSFTFTFKVNEETTTSGKLVFEVGNTQNAALGKVIISNVVLEKVMFVTDFREQGYQLNGETVHGHIIENAGETVFATAEREQNKLTINVDSVGDASYMPHYYYMIPRLLSGTYTFKVSITANVARTLRFNALLPKDNYASLLENNFKDIEVLKDETANFEIDFTITDPKDFVKFEIAFGKIEDKLSLPGVFVFENISIVRK
ncbi:carbohydrate binding domain-containing protein [Haploplasma modicum]|uniref:carbohydrate binding domain-containing protein n=1 Tax=Haploplasma modicum TaxID=2150 RepID=UPI00214B1B00|nr:carbohydrate binding domain-containing protein [Haploplasma modicum]MCR1808790.1 carbohydrate binding domain-containing protein [Haploplasma modicum]